MKREILQRAKKSEEKIRFFLRFDEIFKKTYSWILNLGVDPLFLISFFLFTPFLAILFLLRFSVFFDLETIKPLLQMNLFNWGNLTTRRQFVKTFLGLALILLSSTTWGMNNEDENIIISTGEHKELELKEMQKYTLSNSECLTHKFIPKTKTMLLKGNKVGYAELVVWNKNKQKKTYRVYILTKQKQLQILHLVQTIESTNLKAEVAGPYLLMKGELDALNDYLLIKKLEKENKDVLQAQGTLSPKLRNQLIAEVYTRLLGEYLDRFGCKDLNYSVICEYSQSHPPSKETLEELKNRFSIDFVAIKDIKEKNYLVKLKLIQIEKLDGEELNLGLDKISGNLGELFHEGLISIIEKNQFLLNKTKVHLSTLAEPETVMRIGQPAEIDVGAEISFPTAKNKGDSVVQSTEWKFAGLRIKLDLNQSGDQFQVNFNTEFSRPVDNDTKISGSKEKSSLNLTLKKPIQLFQIGFKTDGENTSALPWLSAIPILGELFKSKSTQSNYKKISGVIILEEYES